MRASGKALLIIALILSGPAALYAGSAALRARGEARIKALQAAKAEEQARVLRKCPALRTLPSPWVIRDLDDSPRYEFAAPAAAFGIVGKPVIDAPSLAWDQDRVTISIWPTRRGGDTAVPPGFPLGHRIADVLGLKDLQQFQDTADEVELQTADRKVWGRCAAGPGLARWPNPACVVHDDRRAPAYNIWIGFSAMSPQALPALMASARGLGERLATCLALEG